MAEQSRFKKLLGYLHPYRKKIFQGIGALFVVNILGIYIPLKIRDIIDTLNEDFSVNTLFVTAIALVVLASIMWGIRMYSRLVIFGVGREIEFDLKQNIFERLLTLEPAYFATNRSGDLISKATSDVDNIRRLVGFAVLSLANTVLAYSFTLPAMLLVNVKLSLLAISVYPIMLMVVQLFSGKLQTCQRDVQEKLSEMSELIQEDMSGMSLIKIYAQEENEKRAFAEKNDNLLNANLKLALTRNFLFPLVESIAKASSLILLAFSVGAIAKGIITVGDFIALLLFVERLVFPTALLGFTITAYQRGIISIDRVESITKVEPAIQDELNAVSLPVPVKGAIEARNLTFSYPGSKFSALQNLTFTINPGETVAIVGSIGSGKSTLANAIPRLIDIDPGQLFLDDQDITAIKLNELRKAIAYVPQDSFLFSTTIKNNIAYGNPFLEQPAIEDSAKSAQIHPEILNFPKQYETLVGERGITLSGGQRQRSALARALTINSSVLILDDALSSVDNQTATDILHQLNGGEEKKTVIFISHQLAAAALADRILVMDQGQIIQSGSHEQLIAQTGLYQSLWDRYQLEQAVQA